MATDFTRPTLSQLLAQAQGDIESAVTGVKARLRRRFERAAAFAIASVADSLHSHLAWVADQIFPDTATERVLLRWCAVFGVQRKAAERSEGTVIVTGAGGDVPIWTRYVRRSDGRLYETTAALADVGEDGDQVVLRAVDGGAAADMVEGEEVSLVTQIADVNATAIVGEGGLAGGTDLESLDDLLLRLLDRIQRPPMGGAPGDYVTWALEVAGVTRAWEYRGTDGVGNPGAGRVMLTFVLDGEEDIIPDAGMVETVQLYLNARAPAEVLVFAPTPEPYDYAALVNPAAGPVFDAIEAEVSDLLRREAEPGGTIRLSRVNEAMSAAEGEIDHDLTFPVSDKTHGFGVIAVPGTATLTGF